VGLPKKNLPGFFGYVPGCPNPESQCPRSATVTSSTGCYDDRRKQNSCIGTLGNRQYKVYTPIHAENKMSVCIYTCMPYIRIWIARV